MAAVLAGAAVLGPGHVRAQPAVPPPALWGVWADVGKACDGPSAAVLTPRSVTMLTANLILQGEWTTAGEEHSFHVRAVTGASRRSEQELAGKVFVVRLDGDHLRLVRVVDARGNEEQDGEADLARRCD
ncbi:hypothetical protein M0638_18035 [Roseomonas sp. NAR14]|uniref:Uncharacterized protein n=1 Tax=Roseomonas acroporae TaxID=2937791 RepID=A0A9X1YAT1_9PROT|nr:hypothetical protein [Roseomonas acroporae]MCK8786280.1 hypothetical protein [Roseomonas acroporae]